MATVVRAAIDTDSEEEEQGARRPLMFVVQARGLARRDNMKTDPKRDWVEGTPGTVRGVEFQLGWEVSGLVGHVYPPMCACV